MTEQLASNGQPTAALERLYARFRDGGAGLVITGNAMIARKHREHPRNLVVDDETDAAALQRFAAACGPHAVVQLSHPGRQALWSREQPVSPSEVALEGLGPFFKRPRMLTTDDIEKLIERFADAARACEVAGFRGVQVHGAHGYLVSQFLSPRVNQRTDAWGGALENRARFLLEIVARIRSKVGATFAVMVKLNSADFQRGGFAEEDGFAVAKMLESQGHVDLLEISGGSYEAPAMVGVVTSSTRAREAYFLEFAEKLRATCKAIPLMVTGGFRTPDAMEAALQSGAVDVIGLARPMAMEPDFPRRVLHGDRAPGRTCRDRLGVRKVDSLLAAQIYSEQLHRIAHGKEPDAHLSRVYTIAHAMWMTTFG